MLQVSDRGRGSYIGADQMSKGLYRFRPPLLLEGAGPAVGGGASDAAISAVRGGGGGGVMVMMSPGEGVRGGGGEGVRAGRGSP